MIGGNKILLRKLIYRYLSKWETNINIQNKKDDTGYRSYMKQDDIHIRIKNLNTNITRGKTGLKIRKLKHSDTNSILKKRALYNS